MGIFESFRKGWNEGVQLAHFEGKRSNTSSDQQEDKAVILVEPNAGKDVSFLVVEKRPRFAREHMQILTDYATAVSMRFGATYLVQGRKITITFATENQAAYVRDQWAHDASLQRNMEHLE